MKLNSMTPEERELIQGDIDRLREKCQKHPTESRIEMLRQRAYAFEHSRGHDKQELDDLTAFILYQIDEYGDQHSESDCESLKTAALALASEVVLWGIKLQIEDEAKRN